ncbi:MAG: prepilin peptidase [Clostridia bacterium]|nr:prepilin peptidase [Clostridia bacterium]
MSIYDDKFITIYFVLIAGILGLALGSFLNCVAYRITQGESFVKGRSKCTACGHELGAMDLVPVLSWVLLKGRCRYCGEKVSARYPITECVFAVLCIICLLKFDLTVMCGRNLVLLSCLFCLSLVDLDSFIIPDGCLIVAVIAWIAGAALDFEEYGGLHGIGMNILAALIIGGGILAISLIMDKVLERDSLGGGDIKLFAVMGLYLGLIGSMFALILACLLGLLFAAARKGNGERDDWHGDCDRENKQLEDNDIVPKRATENKDDYQEENDGKQIPFGPAIAAATCIMLLFGDQAVQWYMGIIGI